MKRPYLTLLMALGVSLVLAPQCVDGRDSQQGSSGSGTGGSPEAGPGDPMVLGEGGGAGYDGIGELNALCGVPAEAGMDCVPDDDDSCRDAMLPGTGGNTTVGSGGSGGTGGSGPPDGEGGMAGEGGQAGAPTDVPIDGGMDVSVPSDTPGSRPLGAACRVLPNEDEEPVRVCAPVGRGGFDAPCTSAADCLAGFSCVVARSASLDDQGGVAAGVCLEYCCRGSEISCSEGSFCTTRVSLGVDGPGLQVPVCEKADNCSLSAPYPCDGDDCQCEEGKACMVVRSDGTTACAEPGEGTVGDECPCAWGHVCSQATGTCLKLCELPATGDGCEGGLCQMAADLPENWGVCIAPAD